MISQRAVFITGAIFNLAVGFGLLFLFPLLQPYLGVVPVPPELKFLVDIVGMFVCAFGVAYWLLAIDFPRYRPFAIFGASCKLLVVMIIALHFFAGHVGWQLLALAMMDLVYAILFILILRGSRAIVLRAA
ncbi:hypothetical protein QY049_03120 [Bradyrhizobium sp. WYCCWR 13022]|uniref:hypothetical protein n=1 Tax=unclassified Bradyrhizobium TaxID=2631580 RepID=UPI00263A9AB5|nr:hypothetical protein [Bradyrhizobium sp. WYCCWR 13022]MDN4982216.1 hypothetical protein [Bradyrhizobium sp. WYCCWR 13022]